MVTGKIAFKKDAILNCHPANLTGCPMLVLSQQCLSISTGEMAVSIAHLDSITVIECPALPSQAAELNCAQQTDRDPAKGADAANSQHRGSSQKIEAGHICYQHCRICVTVLASIEAPRFK